MANKIQIGSTAVVDQIKPQIHKGINFAKHGIKLEDLVPSTDDNYNVGEFLIKGDKANDVYPENIIAFAKSGKLMVTRQLVRYWYQPQSVIERDNGQQIPANKSLIVEVIDRIRLEDGLAIVTEKVHIPVDFVKFPYLYLVFGNGSVTIDLQDEYVNFLCQYFDLLHIKAEEYVMVTNEQGNKVPLFDQSGRPQIKLVFGGLIADRNEEAKIAYEAYLASQPKT